MTISKESTKGQTLNPIDFGLEKHFQTSTLGVELSAKPTTSKVTKDLSLVGDHYGNSVQMEEYTLNPALINTNSIGLMPFQTELNDLDDTYSTFKGLNSLFTKFSTPALMTNSSGLPLRSYISVFNAFRSDFEDFN